MFAIFLTHFEKIQQRTNVFQKKKIGDYVQIGIGWEGQRLQLFEGIITAINREGSQSKITLRKSGVECVFSCQNPNIKRLCGRQSRSKVR